MKAMAKDPLDRYRTARELADDLRSFSKTSRSRRGRSGNSSARGAGAAEILASPCWSVRSRCYSSSSPSARPCPRCGSSGSETWLGHRNSEPRQRKGTSPGAVRAYLGEARASYMTGRQGQRVNGIQAIKNILASFPADQLTDEQQAELRDEAISYVALADLREASRLPNGGDRWLMDINDSLEVYAHPLDGVAGTVVSRLDGSGSDIQLLSGSAKPPAISTDLRTFSDSGRWLAEMEVILTPEGDRRRLRIWDWQAARVVFEEPALINGSRFAFHPDDQHFMAFGGGSALQLFSLTTGKEVSRSPARFANARGSFSPDGKWFAVTSRNVTAEIIDPTTWQTIVTIPEAGPTTCVAWNPVEQYLVFGATDGRIFGWDHVVRRGGFLSGNHRGEVLDLKFSPDGRILASSGDDRMVRLRYVDGDRTLVTITGAAPSLFS